MEEVDVVGVTVKHPSIDVFDGLDRWMHGWISGAVDTYTYTFRWGQCWNERVKCKSAMLF